MAFAVLFIIPIKQLLVVFMAKRKKELTRNYIELWRTFSTWFGNQIGGILEIKLWNLYEKKTGEMKETYREIPHVNWKIQIWDGLEDISGQLIGLALEVVVYVGCGYLACEGKMSVGNILSDGKLMETQTANYFSDIYPIDCAVLSANAQSCQKCCTLLSVLFCA